MKKVVHYKKLVPVTRKLVPETRTMSFAGLGAQMPNLKLFLQQKKLHNNFIREIEMA